MWYFWAFIFIPNFKHNFFSSSVDIFSFLYIAEIWVVSSALHMLIVRLRFIHRLEYASFTFNMLILFNHYIKCSIREWTREKRNWTGNVHYANQDNKRLRFFCKLTNTFITRSRKMLRRNENNIFLCLH